MRKPTCSMYENEDADQLRGNRATSDQRLCFVCVFFLATKIVSP